MHGEARAKVRGSSKPASAFYTTAAISIVGSTATSAHRLAISRNYADGGATAFAGFHKAKTALDKAIAKIRKLEHRGPMPAWTFHDLRRTARTMLAELGIASEIAERVLGHTNGTIEDTYNHHKYENEKREALTKLANHVDRITRAPAPAAKMRLVASR